MKRAVGVLCALAIVAAVLIGADRGAAWLIAGQLAGNMATQYRVEPEPRIEFAGFPFLTQLAAQRFEQVSVDAPRMTLDNDGQLLTLHEVDLRLFDVQGIERPVAGRLAGSGTLDWAGVGELSGQPVSFAGGDRIQVAYSTEVFGASVNALITGRPELEVEQQRLRLADPEIEVAGYRLPSDAAAQLINRLAGPIPLELPQGLRVEGIEVGEAGLLATISGSDVALI